MNYIIGRIEKIRNIGTLAEADRHNHRKKGYSLSGDNINSELTESNEHYMFNCSGAMVDVYDECIKKLKRKPRKDHILALNLFFGYSPEAEVNIEDFKNKVISYMKKTFKDCPFSLDLHLDESTPHIHCLVIPCRDGGFRASDWVGKRSDLTRFQNEIFEEIGKPLGLARGTKGSKAKHKKIQDYYEEITQQQIEEFERVRLENEAIHQKMIDEYNHKIEILQQHTNSLDDEINKYKYEEDHNKLLEFQKMILEYIDTLEKEIQNSTDSADISIFKRCIDLLMTLLKKHNLIKYHKKEQNLER